MLVALFVTGCAQVSAGPAVRAEAPATPVRSAQLIIKFRNPEVNVAREPFLADLARDAGARLVYVRPMSGDAHVLRVEGVTSPQELARVIERLSKRADVAYVEEDARMYHQQNR
jgi:hypothetical protein